MNKQFATLGEITRGKPDRQIVAPWIRGPKLRQRWGDMPNATFYERLNKGLIPKPEYPFGPHTPYWRMSVIEAFEQQAEQVAA